MQAEAVPYKRILFVCTNKRENGEACCSARGSEQLAAQLKERVKALGIARHVRVSKSGCQDVCAKGPSVMLFPESRWYHDVTEQDIERIVRDAAAGIA